LISTEMRRPDVLVLGSSRVMQFRESMVGASGTFFNAGGAAASVADALEFLRRLDPVARPRVMIFGIDQVWLTSFSEFDRRKMEVVDGDSSADLRPAVRVSHRVVNDLISGKISLTRVLRRSDPLDGHPALGMSAIMLGSGFRSDGSYQYGPYRTQWPPVAKRLEEGFARIQQNVVPMVRADSISPAVLDQLRELLALAREDHITVIGFCPPFAPTTLGAMRGNGGFTYLSKIPSTLGDLFGGFGYTFMDWTDPSPLGVVDDDMVDYFHPSERVVARIYQQLITTNMATAR
jgi:hypothetical protein